VVFCRRFGGKGGSCGPSEGRGTRKNNLRRKKNGEQTPGSATREIFDVYLFSIFDSPTLSPMPSFIHIFVSYLKKSTRQGRENKEAFRRKKNTFWSSSHAKHGSEQRNGNASCRVLREYFPPI
jgi:hypothetical protein